MIYTFNNSEMSISRAGESVEVLVFGKGAVAILGGKISSCGFENSRELLKTLEFVCLIDKEKQKEGDLYDS